VDVRGRKERRGWVRTTFGLSLHGVDILVASERVLRRGDEEDDPSQKINQVMLKNRGLHSDQVR